MSNRTWIAACSRWRHGGWYVHNTRYPNGGCGCVSNNYDDKRWRVVCDSRPLEKIPIFSSREDAANGERYFVEHQAMLESLRMFLQLNPTCHRGVEPCGECAVCLGRTAIAKAEGRD